jgi:tetratricopeptide (TPR) repeat protein
VDALVQAPGSGSLVDKARLEALADLLRSLQELTFEAVVRDALLQAARAQAEAPGATAGALAELASRLEQKAATLEEVGALAEARLLLEEAVGLRRRVLHDFSRGAAEAEATNCLAATMDTLAWVLRERGHWEEALRVCEEALAMRLAVLGPAAPEVAQSLNTLGCTQSDAGSTEEALSSFQRAERLLLTALGEQDLSVLLVRANVANELVERGQLDEAEQLFEELDAVARKRFGSRHMLVAAVTLNHGQACMRRPVPQRERAQRMFCEAADTMRVISSRSPRTALALLYTGVAAAEQGDASGAIKYLEECLGALRGLLPPEHPNVVSAQTCLSYCYQQEGRISEAVAAELAALPVHRRALDPDSSRLADRLRRLAALQAHTDQLEDASAAYEEALAIDRRVLAKAVEGKARAAEESRARVANDLTWLAEVRARQDRLDESEQKYNESAGAWADVGCTVLAEERRGLLHCLRGCLKLAKRRGTLAGVTSPIRTIVRLLPLAVQPPQGKDPNLSPSSDSQTAARGQLEKWAAAVHSSFSSPFPSVGDWLDEPAESVERVTELLALYDQLVSKPPPPEDDAATEFR